MISAEERRVINRTFTIPAFDKILYDNNFSENNFAEYSCVSYRNIIADLYKHMASEYRNEYYFKNMLLKKLLLEKHDLETSSALMELPIAESKADFIIINGKGIVYEIKTDFDNFNRLESQIRDYYKAFRYVYLVVSETNYAKAVEILNDSPVGIYVLKTNNSLVKKKTAKSNTEKLNHEVIFNILRKYEYEEILTKHYGKTPAVSSFKYYTESLKWAKEINVKTFQLDMQECLKKRMIKASREDYSMIPESLMLYAYFSRRKRKGSEKDVLSILTREAE